MCEFFVQVCVCVVVGRSPSCVFVGGEGGYVYACVFRCVVGVQCWVVVCHVVRGAVCSVVGVLALGYVGRCQSGGGAYVCGRHVPGAAV